MRVLSGPRLRPGAGVRVLASRARGGSSSGGGSYPAWRAGMVYVPALDAYLFRRGAAGGAVYRIDAGTFETTALSTTGGSGVPVAPAGIVENVYTKWLYVPDYGGCIYLPGTSNNAWFLRVH